MKTKTFDCVEMKHRGAEQLKKKIDRLTVQQELAFWAERSSELKQRQPPRPMRGASSKPILGPPVSEEEVIVA